MDTTKGQSAAKLLNDYSQEEGSTTISQESTGDKITGKQPIYLRKRNVIYKITNIINNKIYIGSASYFDKRIGTHISRLRRNKHDNKYLQSAYNKYGEINFTFSILEETTKELLLVKEQNYLDFYKSYNREIGYNLVKIAGSNTGYKMSEEAKEKIGNFWRGKKFSKERINNIRTSRTIEQGKPILVFDKDMNLLFSFPSISETSRQLNISISAISKQCSKLIGNKRSYKTSKYIFRYNDIVSSL